VDVFFAKLVNFAQELNAEDKRKIAENLSEEELAIFDLLAKPNLRLSKKDQKQVKAVAQDLLETLKREQLVFDWRKKQQMRARVRLSIEQDLERLPKRYTDDIYRAKCETVYQHIYDSYYGEGRSVYALAG
jgi:type I restriction enzyme R subunit